MATTTMQYDVANHLRNEEEMRLYIEAAFEEAGDDAAFIARALGDVARARGMTQIARDAGLSRESLYKALSGERNPDFSTMLKVLRALGLRLHPEPLPGIRRTRQAIRIAGSTRRRGGRARFQSEDA
jgi:probable addiction module antidote protein